MGRSMRSQLHYALDSTTVCGRSRRADRCRGMDTRDLTYSRSRADTLRDRANSLAKYMHDEHPEVRRARDITREHIEGYIESRGGQWSAATRKEVMSEIGVIQRRIDAVYGPTGASWTDGIICTATEEKVRDRAMERADIDRLTEALDEGRSRARDGLIVGDALGLRSCEVCGIRGTDIDIDKMVVHLDPSYTKGGRARDVSIAPEDRDRLKSLAEKYGDSRICPMRSESYDRALRRGMDRAGIEGYGLTTQHAIRKEWALERYISLGGDPTKDPRKDPKSMKAWLTVQKELGHGDRFRPELFKTYIQAEKGGK